MIKHHHSKKPLRNLKLGLRNSKLKYIYILVMIKTNQMKDQTCIDEMLRA